MTGVQTCALPISDGTYWARMTISPDGHEPTVFDIEIRVDSRMPAVVEAPIEGAELGSTVDAVLRPTEGFSITGPVTWRMTDTDQALETTAAAEPDGASRHSAPEFSQLPAEIGRACCRDRQCTYV